MKIAFTYNCRRSDAEEEAEFDTPATASAISAALSSGGHEVARIEIGGESPLDIAARLRAQSFDLIFSTVEGHSGRTREALYPMLFESLGIPYIGSDPYVMTITLDKWLSKLIVAAHGVQTPPGVLLRADEPNLEGRLHLAERELKLPVLVKPNHEGSSKGITADHIVTAWPQLAAIAERMVQRYPSGILIEEYVSGRDVTVPIVHGLGPAASEGVLTPCEYEFSGTAPSAFRVYDYTLKCYDSHLVSVRCPAALPQATLERIRKATATAARALGVRDLARADFRVRDDGEVFFLELNALPSLEPGSSLFEGTAQLGLSYTQTLLHLVEHAAARCYRA